jgi:hypothetical protein
MKPIFSTRIDDQNPAHTRVTVFNRGGNAGTLTVNTSDAAELIARIEGKVSDDVPTWEDHYAEHWLSLAE